MLSKLSRTEHSVQVHASIAGPQQMDRHIVLLSKGTHCCGSRHLDQLEGHVPMIEVAGAVCAELLEPVSCPAMPKQPEMSSHVGWKVKIDMTVLVALLFRRESAIRTHCGLNLRECGRARARERAEHAHDMASASERAGLLHLPHESSLLCGVAHAVLGDL